MTRRKIIRGGELPERISGSGVTIDETTTLEEFVAEEEAKEIGEALVPDNLVTYHKSRARYVDTSKKKGHVRVYTRREINVMNWEKLMENQKNIEGVIAAVLLSGQEMSGSEIQEACMKQLGVTKRQYSTRSTYLYNKTDFGKFIESRRDAKGKCFKLVPAALDCKPGELMHFVYKGSDKAREVVLEHHKGLIPYLEPEKPKEEDVESKLAEKREKLKEKMATMRASKEKKRKKENSNSNGLTEVINDVVAQELGVNVSVAGRIEIVFKWE
jgi:hypothetical protein